MLLKVKVDKKQNGVFMVSLDGQANTDTYLLFEEKLKPLLVPSTKALILDMAKLNYISSAGLGVIFRAQKAIESNNGSFIMSNLPPQIKKVFEIMKALASMSVFKDMTEVDTYLDDMQKKELEKQKDSPEA